MSELYYQDRLPLRWRPSPASTPDDLARLRAGNERLLRLLPALEASGEPGDDDGPLPRHVQLLDLRLQLLTELLGELLAREADLPAPRPIRLGCDRLAWQEAAPPAPGAELRVELFLNPALPRPLELPVRVKTVDEADPDGPAWVEAEAMDLGDAVRDGLVKLVFRHHRRQLARQRGS